MSTMTETTPATETREVATLRWPIAALRMMIDGCAFASAQAGSRYSLDAIHLDNDGERHARAIATDGHRLCTVRAELGGDMSPKMLAGLLELEHTSQLLLSARDCRAASIGASAVGMAEIRAMVRTTSAPGQDVTRERWLELSWRQKSGKNRERSARIGVIDGRFPRWSDIVPSSCERIGAWTGTAGGMLADLLDGPLAHHGWTIGQDSGLTRAHRRAVGLPSWRYNGPEEAVTLDLRMLAEWLSTLDEHIMVTIENHGPERPIVGRAASAIYVQVPVREAR